MSSILIVEDEPRIVAFLTKGLKAAGFTTHTTAAGRQAVALAVQESFDLIIWMWACPISMASRCSSSCAAKEWERRSSCSRRAPRWPIASPVWRAARTTTCPKPFSFEELLARIRVRLRPDATGPDQMRLTHRDMVLDLRTRTLTLEGRTVELSAREFALAETFMRHPGQVLSREQLLSAVWGLDFDPGSNVVEVYVSYLRNKLGRQRVETVRGMGYRLI